MKKVWTICFLAVWLLTLCSCATSTSDNDSAAAIASLEQEITELQQKIHELEEENNILRAGDTSGNAVSDNTAIISDNAEVPPINMELNQTSSLGDIMDITLISAEWSDAVLPSDTNKSYSYKADKDGETYFVVHGTIASHTVDSFDIKWCSDSHILVNEKYNFSATMEFEDLDGRGFGESIKPLQTRNFVIYSSVSDEVYAIAESVQVNFQIPDNEQELSYFYDEDHSNANFSITFSDLNP